jgi:Cytochrome C oxidase, cbb3-type, subunit III
MKVMRVARLIPGLLTLFCVSFFVAAARPAQESPGKSNPDQKVVRLIPSLEGNDLFHSYCATCHGANGKGQGPVSPALNARAPDLTEIAKRNGGIFPQKRIEDIIAGDELVVAHGSREMPIWGPIFHQVELDRDLGNVRLRNLTQYIETIQKK